MALEETEFMMAEIPIVKFKIENVKFGLDVYQISDIIKLDVLTRVPNSQNYIMGVINLRGAIIPVINLRKRLSFENIDYKENCRILVVEFNEELIGLMVDSVSEVIQISSYNIEPKPRYLVNNIDANFLIGLANEKKSGENEFSLNNESEFILLLELGKILNLSRKTNEKSIIYRIIEYKTKMLNKERSKLKKKIVDLKEKERHNLIESGKNMQSRIQRSKKRKNSKAFLVKKKEAINKIKTSQNSKLRVKLRKLESLPKEQQQKLLSKVIKPNKRKKRVKVVRRIKKKSSKTDIQKDKIVKKPESEIISNGIIGKIDLSQEIIEITEDEEKNDTKNSINNLTEMELSLIQEIGNIGAGNAATALSNMIDKRVDISVPIVDILPTESLSSKLGGRDNLSIGIYLAVEGDVSMYMMLIFSKSSGLRLADKLLFQERSIEELESDEPLSQMDESALREVGNILGSHYLTALSEFLNLNMIPSPPNLSFDMLGSIIDIIQIELEQKVDTALILDTDIIVEKEVIEGYFLLLPIPETIKKLIEHMGSEFMEE